MTVSSISTTQSAAVSWKAVALPPEHGAWGFLLEPIVAALAIAPSPAGALLSLGVLGGFLLRQPLKIVYQDRRRGRRYTRTALAERVALLYAALAVTGFLGGLALSGPRALLPLPLIAPLAVLLLVSYSQNRGRELIPELAGASALAGTATAVALAGDAATGPALTLWAILLGRAVPSILYVRARLRLDKGKLFAWGPVLSGQVVAIGGVAALAIAGLAPWLAVIALGILAARAAWGLSPYRPRVRVAMLGVQEVAFGALTVLLTVLGYTQGW
jgi:hypothetical protein